MPKLQKRSYGYLKKKTRLRGNAMKKRIERIADSGARKTWRRRIFVLGLEAFVFGLLFLTVYVAWISRNLPDPDRLTDRQVAQSTKIYDRTGEHLLYEIFADEKRTIVEIEEIPRKLIDAVIATEDKKFYEHKGIRPLSILRAVVYGIFTKRRISGTSTLTQQLVKNAILTNERTVARKLKEAILSIRLEQKYTKDQILKIYFNEIPYGSTNYGVESAAQSYFGKHVSDLTLAEVATLAGFPKAPSRYLNNPDELKNRRNFVLERMFEEGYITREEADAAQAEDVGMENRYTNIKAPHFVLYVREQLVALYGETAVDTGGLKVITTLDWDKQKFAEEAMTEAGAERMEQAGANNAALVALDPKTNQILALVGSKDFFNEEINGQFNVVTLGMRQPGSSIKPIVYASAFEKGFTPETVLFDVITDFAVGGKKYEPKNYDLKEHGLVTMRQALQGSLNIPAVKTLYLATVDKAIEFANRLGYTTFEKDRVGLSLVLGGGEVKMLEHAGAFGVFANDGVRHEKIESILMVEDANGDILNEWKKKKGEQVIDKELAALMNNILSDDEARAYIFGARGVLTLPDRSVAVKTGTTDSYADAWTIGYTPSLVAAVWAGNTDNTPMKHGFGGSKVAGPIWNSFMRKALENTPPESFAKPPENKAEKPVLRGSEGGGITLLVDKVTNKLATSSTPEKYIVERTYMLPHSILHYVDKEDPQGPAPENPEQDPQYSIWEEAIKSWIARKQKEDPEWEVSFEEPPDEYDDMHSLELIPSLQVVYPQPSSTLFSRQIDTDIRVSAPRGVTKVSYKIDDKYVGVVEDHPFNLNYSAKELESGAHTLSIIVEDDVGNRLEENVVFILDASEVKPAVSWVNPPESLPTDSFPRTFSLNHTKLDSIKKIHVKATLKEPLETAYLETMEDFSNMFDNQLLFVWKDAPTKGDWVLTAEIELDNGERFAADSVEIRVE